MNDLPICPNCQVVWSQEEIDWGCGCCGYPNVNQDFMPDDEDDFGDLEPEDYDNQKFTVAENDEGLIFEPK